MAKCFYVVSLLLVITFPFASHQAIMTPKVAKHVLVHSYKLVEQWGNAFCNNLTSPRRCRSSVPQEFTIHGLWGYDQHDNILPNCEEGLPQLSPGHLRGVDVNELNRIWPNHIDGEANFDFWKQQWWKHGRCLGLRPSEYFQKVISLKRQIDQLLGRRTLTQLFISRDLPPSNEVTYDPQWFPEEIFANISKVTQLNCNLDSSSGQVQLYEVRFCFSRRWNLIDCRSHFGTRRPYQASNCYIFSDSDTILFPAAPSPAPSPSPSPIRAPSPSPSPSPAPAPAPRKRRRRRRPKFPKSAQPPESMPLPIKSTYAQVLIGLHTLKFSTAAAAPPMSPTLLLPPASSPPPLPPPPVKATYYAEVLSPSPLTSEYSSPAAAAAAAAAAPPPISSPKLVPLPPASFSHPPPPIRPTYSEVSSPSRSSKYSAAPEPPMCPTFLVPPASFPPPPTPLKLSSLRKPRALLGPPDYSRHSEPTQPLAALLQHLRSLARTNLPAVLVSLHPISSTAESASTYHTLNGAEIFEAATDLARICFKMASKTCKKVYRAFALLLKCASLFRTWKHHLARKEKTSKASRRRSGQSRRRLYR